MCPSTAAEIRPCVVVVDPLSTGDNLARELAKRGYSVIILWSREAPEDMRTHVCEHPSFECHATVEEQPAVKSTAQLVVAAAGDRKLLACIVGCETGVTLADAVSEELGLRTNGTAINRRDKSVQQKCVKSAGMRAVREAAGVKWSSVEAFADSETMPVVVKPVEGAGSEGVKLCQSKADAEAHFNLLMGAQLKVGSVGAAVLVQEYLRGLEYVVDHVSRDGVHKTAMVWLYDKRACNGADFVYFGMLPVPIDSEIAKVLIAYTRGVLDAVGITDGPTHAEVMMTKDGPCLVEVNSRAHGGDGHWVPLARALTGGYSQVDATVDAFLDERAFAMLPDVPPSPFKASGQEVILVCMRGGQVVSTSGFDKIRQLESFVSLDTEVVPGSFVEPSIDLFTGLGSVFLMHDDPEVISADLKIIRDMEIECSLFELKEDLPTTAVEAKGCVIVVDPASTGAVLAAELVKRGYPVMIVWSNELIGEIRDHVPECARNLKYHAVIEQQLTIKATAEMALNAAGDLSLLACIVGCETGVLLADALAEELGLRNNGTEMNRRNKSVQQKCVKAAGVRAVREAVGVKWSSVEAFAGSERMPVVVKPVESAGSEGVKLCKSKAAAEAHFNLLMGAQLKVGSVGAAVLVQEYLQGREYVVDHVSRDGVHKAVMIWVYDKRARNGADFVYFGLEPVQADSEIGRVLVSYTRAVLDALDIRNGPTHAEVMMTADGPCLVEVNIRAHGGDGYWAPLARALTGGYSQVDVTIDAFLDGEAFEMLPDVPASPFKASGQEVMLVCMQGGTVVSTPGFDKIRQMKSFLSLASDVAPGSVVEPSIDLFTCLGSAFLMHDDPAVMAADLKIIRNMETECSLFELEQDAPLRQISEGKQLLELKGGYASEKMFAATSKEALHIPLRQRTCSGPSSDGPQRQVTPQASH